MSTATWETRFDRFFRPAHREIDFLKVKIKKRSGLLIFKWHDYSIDELLRSEHHSKIDSITRKIGDDASNWYKRGELPESAKDIYEKCKYNLEEELHELNLKIAERKPTWFEQAKGTLQKFVEVIRENMPTPVRNLLEDALLNLLGVPIIGTLSKRFLPSGSSDSPVA